MFDIKMMNKRINVKVCNTSPAIQTAIWLAGATMYYKNNEAVTNTQCNYLLNDFKIIRNSVYVQVRSFPSHFK